MGKGMQQDVLRSQVEITMLLQRVTVLEQQRATAQARLNTFMARDPGIATASAASVEPAALNEKLDALYSLAAKNDTSLQREQQMVEKTNWQPNWRIRTTCLISAWPTCTSSGRCCLT